MPGERVSKYDSRPTSGAVPVPSTDEQVDETPVPAEPAAAAAGSPEATEVVFDLREDEAGFEGTYWKEPAERPAADGESR